MMIFSFIFGFAMVMQDPEITFHNLPVNPVDAYDVSTTVFIAKIRTIKPANKNEQIIDFDIVEQIKGHLDASTVLVKNGEALLNYAPQEARGTEKDNPLFYFGFRAPGRVNPDIAITFNLDKNTTFLVMLAPYGMHSYSFLSIDEYPELIGKIRSEKLKNRDFSFMDFMPHYEYIYEVDCGRNIVLSRRVSKTIQIKELPKEETQREILKRCGSEDTSVIYLFGLYHSDLMITDEVALTGGWVFPWTVRSDISSKYFLPFRLLPHLDDYYRSSETVN